MPKDKGIVAVPLLIILVILAVGLAYFLISKGFIKNPTPKLSSEVNLKTLYKNPFKQESHYLNPFDEYKNPFDVIRATEEDE